jgi:hypothetical protein
MFPEKRYMLWNCRNDWRSELQKPKGFEIEGRSHKNCNMKVVQLLCIKIIVMCSFYPQIQSNCSESVQKLLPEN